MNKTWVFVGILMQHRVKKHNVWNVLLSTALLSHQVVVCATVSKTVPLFFSEPEDASRHTARDPPPRGGAALPPTHHVVIVRVSVTSGFARGIRLCFVSDVLQPQASSASCRSSLRWTQHCCSRKGKCSSTKCSPQQCLEEQMPKEMSSRC